MNYKDIIFWIMIVFIFGLGGYLIFFVHSESALCLANPYTYSISLLEEANGNKVDAIITSYGNKSANERDVTMYLDNKGFHEIITVIGEDLLGNINYNNSFPKI